MDERGGTQPSTVQRWLLLAGVGVVVGPAAVVATVLALSVLVLDATGGGLTLVLGVVAFVAVAIGTWYAAGRVAGTVTLRFGSTPFVALGLMVPSLLALGYVAWSVVEDSRVLVGVLVFLTNALLLVVLGVRAAEQSFIRRLRGPGPPGRAHGAG